MSRSDVAEVPELAHTPAQAFTRALDGILVVSVEQAVAAPLCTSRLAEAGARVIKIERPEGDFARGYDRAAAGMSAYFVWLNRGKESVCLDLKVADDARLLADMIAKADVFVQNLAPGALARLGFDSEALRVRHPRLITVDITGYGDAPEVAHLKAYDLLVQSESALASITGSPDAPGRVGVSVCDIACGMNAFAAVLQALLTRQQTGRGLGIAVSLFDAIADWMAVPLLQLDGGLESKRVGMNHPTIAPYGAYQTGDGKQVVFSIQNQREWQRFCTSVLRRPELTVDPRFVDNTARLQHRKQLDSIISGVFVALSRSEVCERLRGGDIAFGSLNSLAELGAHPALRRYAQAVGDSDVQMVSPPVRIDGESTHRPATVPLLNANGDAIRAEFGASSIDQ
jgi:itaconate CoA-transferase